MKNVKSVRVHRMEAKSNYQLITIVYCKKKLYGLSNVNNSTGTGSVVCLVRECYYPSVRTENKGFLALFSVR